MEKGPKVYVGVVAEFSPEGKLMPRSITWEDGQVYPIDSIGDVRREASLKAGGTGIRYLVTINGKETKLFREDSDRWFVERRY